MRSDLDHDPAHPTHLHPLRNTRFQITIFSQRLGRLSPKSGADVVYHRHSKARHLGIARATHTLDQQIPDCVICSGASWPWHPY